MKTPSIFKKFTLIELLITIAIIAILAGMLLPALNSARQTAHQVKCAGSMRQMGVAAAMYAQQYNDWSMPFAFNYHPKNTSTMSGGTRFPTNWELIQFLNVKANQYGYWDRQFVCPNAPRTAAQISSYPLYTYVNTAYGMVNSGETYPSSPDVSNIVSLKKIQKPSTKILFNETTVGSQANYARRNPAESNAWWATHDNTSSVHNAYRHKNDTAFNITWFDGHVTSTTYQTMIPATMEDAYFPYRP